MNLLVGLFSRFPKPDLRVLAGFTLRTSVLATFAISLSTRNFFKKVTIMADTEVSFAKATTLAFSQVLSSTRTLRTVVCCLMGATLALWNHLSIREEQ